MALCVGFIYLVACLARQWMKERGISDMALSVEFIYLAARLVPWSQGLSFNIIVFI